MSDKTPYLVSVVFRRFANGDILALMPYEIADNNYYCTSYEHNGQHSSAYYEQCIKITSPANAEEYAVLKRELENIGYVITVISRVNAEKVRQAIFEFNKRFN